MLKTIRLDCDETRDWRPQSAERREEDAGRMREDVASVTAAVLASAAAFAAWRLLKNLIYNWDFYWKWDAIDFGLLFETGALMDAALLSFAICMFVVAQPRLARLMARPWDGRSETSAMMYWLSSAACAACLLMASSGSLPLEAASHLGMPADAWGIPLQLSYVVASVAAYALIAEFTKERPGLGAAVALCLAPLVALASPFVLMAIGVAYIAIHVLRKMGDALNRDDEWTDEDEEMLDDLLRRRSRFHADAQAFETCITPDGERDACAEEDESDGEAGSGDAEGASDAEGETNAESRANSENTRGAETRAGSGGKPADGGRGRSDADGEPAGRPSIEKTADADAGKKKAGADEGGKTPGEPPRR